MSRYVIVRTQSAGVFAGDLDSRKDREVVLSSGSGSGYGSGSGSGYG